MIWTQGTTPPNRSPLQLGWAKDGEDESQPNLGTTSDMVDKQLGVWSLEII